MMGRPFFTRHWRLVSLTHTPTAGTDSAPPAALWAVEVGIEMLEVVEALNP